ncbi:thiamine pyrophosphate-binding protein [Saccharopolyspora sp. NPDC000995]
MRVADYIVEYIRERNVRTVFMLSGTGSIFLDEAIAKADALTCVCARHEAAATLMGTGASKLTGDIGVAVVTSGPGAANAMAGLIDAWVDAVPVLVLAGQVESRHIDRAARSFGIQGYNVVDCVRPVTKYAAVVDDPVQIRAHLDRAFHEALTGRPGPVWLDVPLDVQAAEVDPAGLAGFEAPAPEPWSIGPAETATVVLDELRGASRPMFVVGQGVRQARAQGELAALVEHLGVPTVFTRLGYDLLPYRSEAVMGQGGIRGRPHVERVMREADLVVSLGASLSTGLVGEHRDAFSPQARVVMVDLDPGQFDRANVAVDVRLRMDLLGLLTEMNRQIKHDRTGLEWPPWRNHCRELKEKSSSAATLATEPINSYYFVNRLEAQAARDAVFVVDTGSAYYVTGQTLEFNDDQREVTSAALLNMGAAVPMAVGASFAAAGGRVITIVGDGAIELNIQELATISDYERDIKVFVLNNGGYSSIRESQDALCTGRVLDEPAPLDFRAVAAAFRIPYHRLSAVDALDDDLAALLGPPGPALIEVICDSRQKLMRPAAAHDIRAHDGVTIPTRC